MDVKRGNWRHGGGDYGGGVHRTVRRPNEIDPTNFSVETVLVAMVLNQSANLSLRSPGVL